MKAIDYMSVAEDSIARIKKGAFLTVQSGDRFNTMAIGWAAFGFIWGKPIMMVAVRLTRHTFGLIEAAGDFTVTVPLGDLSREIAFCGSKSGRDYDKLKECGLKTAKSRHVLSPVIATKGRHYECRIVYKSAMDPTYLDAEYAASLYPQRDYHTLYFGEVLACYETG